MSMNSVVLGGNATKDPELKTFGESKVARFSIAVNRPYKRNDQYVTDFFEVEFWGKQADYVASHVAKGVPVVVHGRVEIENSEKDGVVRRFIKVKADDIEVYPKRTSGGQSNTEQAAASAPKEPTVSAAVTVTPTEDESELPF